MTAAITMTVTNMWVSAALVEIWSGCRARRRERHARYRRGREKVRPRMRGRR